jgi:hypothetical protein
MAPLLHSLRCSACVRFLSYLFRCASGEPHARQQEPGRRGAGARHVLGELVS